MDINSIGNSANAQNGSTVAIPATSSPAQATSPVVVTSSVSTVPVAPGTTPTAEQAKKAVDAINASLTANGNSENVQFAVDPSSKRVVIQVIDKQTNTVIRQVPNEEIIQMSLTLDKKLGQVINQQA